MNSEKVPHVLVVEDEASLARFLQLELTHDGYQVDTAGNGYEALGRISEGVWDLVILDLMLPGLDGFQVCQRIREKLEVPIIMLTARDGLADKVKGLNEGADDYITKPFEIEELLARVKARLRRPAGATDHQKIITVGDLTIHLDHRQVLKNGQNIPLTKREFDLLAYLAENAGSVLSREMILTRVWGYDYFGDTNVVDVYIRYLRTKIDEPFQTKLLQTVRGIGYTLREDA